MKPKKFDAKINPAIKKESKNSEKNLHSIGRGAAEKEEMQKGM
jgi:hypothetical protein